MHQNSPTRDFPLVYEPKCEDLLQSPDYLYRYCSSGSHIQMSESVSHLSYAIECAVQRLEYKYAYQEEAISALKYSMRASGVGVDDVHADMQPDGRLDLSDVHAPAVSVYAELLQEVEAINSSLTQALQKAEQQLKGAQAVISSERTWFSQEIERKDRRIAELENQVKTYAEQLHQTNQLNESLENQYKQHLQQVTEQLYRSEAAREELRCAMERKISYLKRALGEE